MKKFETKDYIGTCASGPQVEHELYKTLLEWYKKHEAFSGESICQCDEPELDAKNILSDIAEEVFRFKVKMK